MNYLITLLAGGLLAVMVWLNGGLSELHGVYHATVLIHLVGLMCICAVILIRRDRFRVSRKLPWYLFSGGAVGVITVVFSNMAFGAISVSAILAVGLLGQTVSSGIIDSFGLLGLPKRPFQKRKLIGIGCMLIGVACILLL